MIYKILCEDYELPKLLYHTKWNENLHKMYPTTFKENIFTFLCCVKRIGLKKGNKIPKFVLYVIIQHLSLPFNFPCALKDLTNSMESPKHKPTSLNDMSLQINANVPQTKQCQIF